MSFLTALTPQDAGTLASAGGFLAAARGADRHLTAPAAHTPPALEPLLTAADVARILNIPPKKVYELDIHRTAISVGRVRFAREDVQAFIARCRRRAA